MTSQQKFQGDPPNGLRALFVKGIGVGIGIGASVMVGLFLLGAFKDEPPKKAPSDPLEGAVPISAREWSASEIAGLWTCRAATRWESEATLIRLSLSAPDGSAPLRFSPDAWISVRFCDAEGFELMKEVVPGRALIRMVDSGSDGRGRTTGYTWKGRVVGTRAADYARFAQVEFAYAGIDVPGTGKARAKEDFVPVPPPQPVWRDQSNWRKLEKGMSPTQVQALLGEPTSVDSGVFTYWVYGGKKHYRFANVMFDSKMRVFGWKEP